MTKNFTLFSLVTTLFFFLNINYCHSQNPAYKLINDSVFNIIEDDYFKAKENLKQIEKHHLIDPGNKVTLLQYSLKNNDLKFFKKQIKKLIKNNGFNQTTKFIEDVKEDKNLTEWIKEKENKLYPIWIKNNIDSYDIQNYCRDIHTRDQMRGYFYEIQRKDSNSNAKMVLRKVDRYNLSILKQLAIKNNGILPNNFDHGLHTSLIWQGAFLHNLCSGDIMKNWNEALPYIENTYFAGKINDGLFRLLDQQLKRYLGVQYYGFENDTPILDKEHLKERKKKYGFAN